MTNLASRNPAKESQNADSSNMNDLNKNTALLTGPGSNACQVMNKINK